ncbi:Gnk2-like domain containing protein [Trema orientale]|uniref:Gnk2-like domain containing protein n=1 Tax=Trema orientale TaxID=63057 RepID=A0A2P5BT34_TREOI|nr:Gnk2-like domain containing protein [Trema orientale]
MSLLNSNTNTITTFLCFLTFTFLLPAYSEAGSLGSYCSTDGNFTSNDSFDKNSKELLGYFNYKLARNDFVLGSKGHGPDQARGYAHCYYGVSAKDCQTCNHKTANEILEKCPYSKEAIMIYENCVLKYSNMSFFGKVDNYQISLVFAGSENASSPAEFDGKKMQLLSTISDQVSWKPRLASTGESIDGSPELYGLAQCTKDLSSLDCKKCLDGAYSEIQACCSGKLGAMGSFRGLQHEI